ncbi:MAG: IS1634 family transposase [Candidatus Eisenbacteria sp.]|nr:IS1634 family transposase [Candidatus Eisenbacteria bacterium]
MYVETVPNRSSPPAILLREGWREGKRTCKRTLANLSHWPPEQIESLRRLLRGERLVSIKDVFAIEESLPHGHVEAVLGMVGRLGLERLLSSRRCRERDLVVGMLVEQLIHPCSKLATTRMWHTTTLAQELSIGDADEDALYDALDWLLERQRRIESKLARRHLSDGCLVLYDVPSSYYEGHTCPLVCYGHNRDKKKGKPIIVYGVMTDAVGRPVAVEVYPGNTGDPSTVPDQVEKLRKRFGLRRVVLVGDRGMLTQTQIKHLKTYPGVGWISALRSPAIRKLVESGVLQMSLFDRQNLAETFSPEYPGERLVACMNPLLKEQRRRKRRELLGMTEPLLEKIVRQVARRTKKPLGKDEIGLKVGKVINAFKVGKHFKLRIEDGQFTWERNEASIQREEALDGIYVIRTSEPREGLSAEDAVRQYKSLSQVERLFRTLKGIDIRVRPIRHRTAAHVRAHIFLCVLAYYVEWHMRQALAPLLFDDEELGADRKVRDPVAPARPSASARRKKAKRVREDGLPVHSFETLLRALATRCRNMCRMKSAPAGVTIRQLTEPTSLQARAAELLAVYPVGEH